MSVSTLFFKKTSVIDHALLGAEGPKGGSYNLNFTASLPADQFDEEQVVVDFSSGKKEVKELIDRHIPDSWQNGFDHKLWVPTRDTKVDVFEDGTTRVEDDFVIVVGPHDAFRFLDMDHIQIEDMIKVEQSMSDYLNSHIDTNVEYNVILDDQPYPEDSISAVFRGLPPGMHTSTSMFRYSHGLRESTSFGCKNILHGHLSFVRVTTGSKAFADTLASTIANLLDDTYIYHEGIITRPGKFQYTTTGRGFMSLEFKNPAKQLVIPLTKEPTVENIVEWVKNHNLVQTLLKQSSFPVQIQVSEGLQKGAMFVAN